MQKEIISYHSQQTLPRANLPHPQSIVIMKPIAKKASPQAKQRLTHAASPDDNTVALDSEEASTKINKNSTISLTILKSEADYCFAKNNDPVNVKECASLQRILHALQYYSVLKPDYKSSINTNELLIDFCENAYPHLLSDYQHVITTHDPHLEMINSQLLKSDEYKNCDLSECLLSRRYNNDIIRRTGDIKSAKIIDPKLMFYQEWP